MIYQWADGARQKIKAQIAGERLERLRERAGGLTAEAVVEDARLKRSPLHAAFEWDNAEAAHQYRLEQARHMLRHIVVVYDEQPEAKPVRAFVVVTRDDEQSYESMIEVMSDEALRRQVLQRAWRELESWRIRYAELEEFSAVFTSISAVKAG